MQQQTAQVPKEEEIVSSRQTVSPTNQNKKSHSRAALLLQLQRTHGNRYVRQHLESIPKNLNSSGQGLESKKRIFFQPKLTIGAPGDKYEQEADSVAEQVMRMP